MKTRLSRKQNNSASAAQSAQDDWVAVGEIVGVFGTRGEIKIQPLTSFPERFAETPTLFIGDTYTPYKVVGAHTHKQQVLLQLEGVTDMEAAEQFRGQTLYIPADQLHALSEDQFYLHDIIGLEVYHSNGLHLGIVKDVLITGGTDLFVIQRVQTGEEVLLPAVKAFIKQVDMTSRRLIIEPIPGLFDDEFETAL